MSGTELMGIGALARSAGVSTQHCRDLEAGGVLPPAERTRGGHRRFTEVHAFALRVYERLSVGYGFGSAHQMLSQVNSGRVDEALELVDERHAVIRRQREETRETLKMLREAGADERSPRLPSFMSVGEVARTVGVSVSTVRHWEGEGLVTPRRDPQSGYRRYRRHDVLQLRIVKMLRDVGYTIGQVRGVVTLLERDRPERAFELAERRLQELADASRAALSGDAVLWEYIELVSPIHVRKVGAHILYG